MTKFLDCERTLTTEEIDAINLRYFAGKLPADLLAHYASFNGGHPENDWFPATDEWDAIWVQTFFPMKYPEHSSMTLEIHYTRMKEQGVIPANVVPFATDPGGNFLCVDVAKGGVMYFTTDSFDPQISEIENHKLAQRRIAASFGEFVACLTTEDMAFE